MHIFSHETNVTAQMSPHSVYTLATPPSQINAPRTAPVRIRPILTRHLDEDLGVFHHTQAAARLAPFSGGPSSPSASQKEANEDQPNELCGLSENMANIKHDDTVNNLTLRSPVELDSTFAHVLQPQIQENDAPPDGYDPCTFSVRHTTPSGFPSTTARKASSFLARRRLGVQNENTPTIPSHNSSKALVSSSATQEFPKEDGSEIARIDAENERRLASMSIADIQAAQQEITQALSPETLNFLAKRAAAKRLQSAGMTDTSRLPLNENPKTSSVPAATVPSASVLEDLKLEWTNDLDTNVISTSYALEEPRFDLEGHVLSPEADIPVHVGLHHHGKDAALPGYTVEELTLYAKSSVASQRAWSFRVLLRIIQQWKRVAGYSADCRASIESSFIEHKTLLALRVGLDDRSNTVVSAALSTLESWICFSLEQELWNAASLTTSGYSIPEIVPLSKSYAQPSQTSLAAIYDLLRTDWHRALLETNIITRLCVLLESSLPEPDHLACLSILLGLARYSPAATHVIALDQRLLHLLSETMMSLEESKAVLAMQIIRIVCQRDRDYFTAIFKSYAIENLFRHLLLDVESRQLSSNDSSIFTLLVQQVLLFLQVTFAYKEGAALFDEYYTLIFSVCQHYIPQRNDVGICALGMLTQVVVNLNMDVGGFHDKIRPFVSLILDLWQTDLGKSTDIIAENSFMAHCAVFISSYAEALKSHDPMSYSSFCHHLSETNRFPFSLFLNRLKDTLFTRLESPLHPEVSGFSSSGPFLMTEEQWSSSMKRVHLAQLYDILDGLLRLAVLVKEWMEVLLRSENERIWTCVVSCLLLGESTCDWYRYFSKPGYSLLTFYMRHVENIPSGVKAVLISSLGYRRSGEEEFGSAVLECLLFPQGGSQGLLDFYQSDLKLINNAADATQSLSCPFYVERYARDLFPDGWMWKPLLTQSNANFSIFKDCLRVCLSSAIPGSAPSYKRLLDVLMHEFKADTVSNIAYPFEDEEICEWLDTALVQLSLSNVLLAVQDSTLLSKEKTVNPDSPTFIPPHQRLTLGCFESALTHFAAVSFGNATFARYLLVPLSMPFPAPFRRLFWGVLGALVRSFSIDLDFFLSRELLEPLEQDSQVLMLQRFALDKHRLTPDRSPLLFHVASRHTQRLEPM